jgi:hypothetical protein
MFFGGFGGVVFSIFDILRFIKIKLAKIPVIFEIQPSFVF